MYGSVSPPTSLVLSWRFSLRSDSIAGLGTLDGLRAFLSACVTSSAPSRENCIDWNDRMRFSNRMHFLAASALGIVADVFAMGDAYSARMQQAHVAAFVSLLPK